MRKNCSTDREKLLKFVADSREFAKIFSERSVNVLIQNAFLTCSWRFHRYYMLEQFEFKLEKLSRFRILQEKLEKSMTYKQSYYIEVAQGGVQ